MKWGKLNSTLILVPLLLWCVHILFLVPYLDALHGESKFIAAAQYFIVSGLIMGVCEVVAFIQLVRTPHIVTAVAVVLNLSWLYYVKVLAWGPTIGNL